MTGRGQDVRDLITEDGWPCQRLRIAFSLILFFFFETLIGKQLPQIMPFIMLGLGIACLASAMSAIQKWRLESQLALVQAAIDQRAAYERQQR